MVVLTRFNARAFLVTPLAILWRAAVVAKLSLRHRAAPKGRHLLLVSWDFPPSSATGVHVPASLVRYACAEGWQVSVVCAPAPAVPSAGGVALAECLPPIATIHRVSSYLATEHCVRLHPAWTLPDIDGGYLNAVALADKAFKALRHDPPSVIVASGPRFANFLAARWLARVFAARLVLHYRDEWTVNTPAFVQNTPRDREEEALCLEQADLASFVSEGKRDVYRAAFPHLDPAKLIVVPNGWEPYFHEKAQNTRRLPADAFTVSYTGRWHASLATLLGAFTAALVRWPNTAPRLLLVIVGNQLPENERLLAVFRARHTNHILVLEATTQTAAIEIQRDSAALLLINDHIYSGVVPLKTFDYLCSSRPILVFGRSGGAAEIVRSLGAGLSVSVDDPQAFGDALIALLHQPAAWDTPARRAWCARHSRAVLFGSFFAAIDALHRVPSPASDAADADQAGFVKSGTVVRSDVVAHG